MSSNPLSERIRNLIGWFDPEFSPEAQIVNGLANEVRDMENAVTGTRPRIIRNVAELKAEDPDTVVWPARHYGPYAVGALTPDPFIPEWTPPLPAVVICEAADVRAARKALRKETPND